MSPGDGRVTVRFMRLAAAHDLPAPEKATEHAAGFDLRACVDAPMVIEPGARALVPTGWAVEIPPGYEGQVRPRSGLALHKGIGLPNAPGTIDADYRGELGVIMINHGATPFLISRGERIAQLVIQRLPDVAVEIVDELPATARGAGGFGSTGQR